jgi:hypothetical protein
MENILAERETYPSISCRKKIEDAHVESGKTTKYHWNKL